MSPSALVYGIAIAGEATARALHARGYRVLVADDAPNDERRAAAAAVGAELVESPDLVTIERLVAAVDLVAPAPGVAETHAVVTASLAAGTPLRSEIDLAYEWEQDRPGGPRPMVAITGTDGKTTTTLMAAALLASAGHRVAAAGNTELPLIEAIDQDVDVFAVECSSFRLAWTPSFRSESAVWLNLAPDHQNWHTSMASYESAKARVWSMQRPSDVAIGWTGSPTVMARLAHAPARHVSYGLHDGDYRLAGASLLGPAGEFASAASLVRTFPHDLANALAASAACLEAGLVDPSQVDAGLSSFEFPPHRIEPLGRLDGVEWFNDSKATSPHAALTAIRSFDRLVLIAGGRNKGLDLASLATEPQRMHAVVAIGESAADVASAFEGVCPVDVAGSMVEAATMARRRAVVGDAVLLSPACASFDWYPNGGYPARGEDFRACFEAMVNR